MAKKGRPTLFTTELLEKILDWISDGGTERAFFRQPNLPTWRNWTKFKRANLEELRPQLLASKEDYCEVKEDEIQQIANDTSRDVIFDEIESTTKDGRLTVKKVAKSDNTAINRDRLRIDTIWKLMRATMPRKYGDKTTTELTGADGKDFTININLTPREN